MAFRKTAKYIVYLIILLIPFFLFFSHSELFRNIKLKIVHILISPIKIISLPIEEAKKILSYHQTFEEYKKIRKEAGILKSRLVGLEEVIKQNTRLEKLLKFQRNSIYSSVVANVIGRNPSYWNASLAIDKGSRDGIRQGFPVVNELGVIGKIAEVGLHTSKVLLLSDPEFSIAAITQDSRENGLISGSLSGECRMRYMNPQARIGQGEKIVTSLLSSSFPAGLLIGEVVEVYESSKDSSIEGIVHPAVSLSQIEEVLVILK